MFAFKVKSSLEGKRLRATGAQCQFQFQLTEQEAVGKAFLSPQANLIGSPFYHIPL